MKKEMSFFEKKRLPIADVMYMTRADRQTVLHLKDGTTLSTYIPMKQLVSEAAEGSFVVVNKGIALAPGFITKSEKNTYTMVDGSTFTRRVHQKKSDSPEVGDTAVRSENVIWSSYAILDDSPMAFCIIELVFDKDGRGMDFIFRYCNKAMETLEGKTREEMINQSFYAVFKEGDKKWLVTYADVALNGRQRVIESYSPEVERNLRIYCHQPKPNFCACALVEM